MDRAKDIHLYRRAGYTYQAIANMYDISRQRANQIYIREENRLENNEKEYQRRIKHRPIELKELEKNREKKVLDLFTSGLYLKNNNSNKGDSKILNYWIKKKYRIFRNGWPDYIIFNGKKWIGIELKYNKDIPRIEQLIMKKIFESMGIDYIFLYEKEIDSLTENL